MTFHIPYIWNTGRPSKRFLAEAAASIPPNTPDLCLLEQKEEHLVFNYGDSNKHGKLVGDAFTQERLSMFQQNWIEGTPPLALKVWGDISRMVPRARIKGSLYLIPTKDLVYIDNQRQNGLLSHRKRVKFLLPPDDTFIEHPAHVRAKLQLSFPSHEPKLKEVSAFMFFPSKEHWIDRITWDQQFYKGRGGAFSVAPTYKDECSLIGNYFKHCWQEAQNSTKCFLHYHQGLADPPIPIVTSTPTSSNTAVGVINGATVTVRRHE